MSNLIRVSTCKICGDEFPQPRRQGRPNEFCSSACKARATTASIERYRKTQAYRDALKRGQERKRERYNPWLWENTILEWDE